MDKMTQTALRDPLDVLDEFLTITLHNEEQKPQPNAVEATKDAIAALLAIDARSKTTDLNP
jgi:hypothetical protein